MERKNPFKGLGIALVTPFKADGSIDIPALEALTERTINEGADFLCVLGTTAETPCLTPNEQQLVKDTVRRTNNHRLPLLLGAGGNCTAAVVEHLQHTDLDGFDGVLIVCPFYNKPSQEGLYRHFCTVAQASPLPVVLYNVPSRTGVNLEAATTLRIASDCPNVVAVKEASGKIAQIEEIVRRAPHGFEVLSGDDAITFELLSLGAIGVISVVGNSFPGLFGQMVHAMQQGNIDEARTIHMDMAECYRLLSADGNPAGIKAQLAALQRIENVLRLPLVPAREETSKALGQIADSLNKKYKA